MKEKQRYENSGIRNEAKKVSTTFARRTKLNHKKKPAIYTTQNLHMQIATTERYNSNNDMKSQCMPGVWGGN